MPSRTGDPEEDVELGQEVQAKSTRPSGPVVAVRMPRDLLARISDYANARNMTVSEVLRQGAERLVRGTVQIEPHWVTGAQVHSAQLVTGSPSLGRAVKTFENWELRVSTR